MEQNNKVQILVPIDYSDCSIMACRYAMLIAAVTGGDIRLLHVYYLPAFDLIELSGTVQFQTQVREELNTELEQTEKENLQKLVKELEKLRYRYKGKEFTFSYDVIPGIPSEDIIRYAEELKPDLVVMGTHGKGKSSMLIGSVTENVIKKIKFPLLSIPEDYKFIPGDQIRNLLYITEFDESDFVSIKKLMSLIEPFNINMYFVHINDTTTTSEWDKIKMEGLKEYFRKVYNLSSVDYFIINSKNLFNELDQIIKDKEINILSLTTRKRNLFERLFKADLTKQLFYNTQTPLLVFQS